MLNSRFFTPMNIAVITAFTVAWRVVAKPIFNMVDMKDNG